MVLNFDALKLQEFPSVYYMTLDECVDRQKSIQSQFKEYGITPKAIISKRFSESNDIVIGKYLHELNEGTAGCCVSHLKAIKLWYETTDENYAFFCEDDLSLESVQYWNFTWSQFIVSLPENFECVQLLTIRKDFQTFELRERQWDDWGATAYLITRQYAKKLIDIYIKEDTFNLEIPNFEIMPLIENILFITGKTYTIPLFVENIEFDSTFTKDQDDDVNSGQKNNHKIAHSIVLNYWKSKMKKYNIVDCFPYFNEKEILELRINLLKDYVDLFVIIDANYTHSGSPKSFTCRDIIEELDLPKDKIQLIELNMSDDVILNPESKIESREAFQRDAIKNVLDQFNDDTVFIISDCDEIIEPKNINFLSNIIRANQIILKIPLVFLEGRADLRVYHKDRGICAWDLFMFMCLKEHLNQTPATHIRIGRTNISYATEDNQILSDLGWHFSWMQSPEDRVYKFQSFCHANDDLKLITNADYSKEEHIEFMKSYIPKEGEITPYGDVDKVLKKYPTENLPDIIWNLPRVKNYLLPENKMIKNELEQLLTEYSLDTENPQHNFNLGLCYENMGHNAPASSYFLRCAERTEDDDLAYEALIRSSYCYDKQGNRDGSVKSLLEQAHCLLPKRPEAYFLLSRFAERKQWWQDCYIYANQGLIFADHDTCLPLITDVEYPGKYGLLFEKAVSAYWWGKNNECKEIFLDLKKNYTLNGQYEKSVNENLEKLGIKFSDYESKNVMADENFFTIEYQNACNNTSDINENLPILYEIAKECSHITEFGVRSGMSTRAFLNTNASLRSYDLSIDSDLNDIFKKAIEFGKDVSYIEADVLNIQIEETDLLFIDTWHQYDQLKQELKIHGKKSRKYIAFHDTQTYGLVGESCSNASSGEIITDYISNPIGLLPAIIEFMIDNPEWKFKIHKTNNNGLTVLEKKKLIPSQ